MERLGEYKMTALNRIMENDRLTKLLAHDTPNALFKESVQDPYSLMYKRLFPFRFVPDPIQDQGTFITLGASGFRRLEGQFHKTSDEYQTGQLYFYFFTHVDLMRTDNGVRQDLMLAEIGRMFDETRGIGMGKLQLGYAGEMWIHNNKFGGYTMSFTMTDFS